MKLRQDQRQRQHLSQAWAAGSAALALLAAAMMIFANASVEPPFPADPAGPDPVACCVATADQHAEPMCARQGVARAQ